MLGGVDGREFRQLVGTTWGTVAFRILQTAPRGFILLSTARSSIAPLAALPTEPVGGAFRPPPAPRFHPASAAGVDGPFTCAPVSLYGATKLASEILALEYGETFCLPVFINRCGVLAGAGQFGRPDQGIFAYWINGWLRRRPLKYIGFGGTGHQVRDCLHPRDLMPVLAQQLSAPTLAAGERIANFSGGTASAMSLRQLSEWCAANLGPHAVAADPTPRPFDIPWLVLDHAKATRLWQWCPATPTPAILMKSQSTRAHPEWLDPAPL